MPTVPDRKFLRSDSAVDQRAFNAHHQEVGLGTQDSDQVWTDILSLGKMFLKNIADPSLGRSIQPNRGTILITRLESSQQTLSISFSAKNHELPKVTMPHNATKMQIPREDERRSLTTARHQRNARATWLVTSDLKDENATLRRLALGGFTTNLGNQYKQKEAELERLEKIKNEAKKTRARHQCQDNIQF